jgi:hypothetical protein
MLDIRLRFILNQIEPRKMIAAIDNLPSDLTGTYEDVLRRIELKKKYRFEAVRIQDIILDFLRSATSAYVRAP